MKTREELEAMGLAPSLAKLLSHDGEGWELDGEDWAEDGAPIFTPGHEPVGKEGRELLRVIAGLDDVSLGLFNITRDNSGSTSRVIFTYRDSLTPKPPEFEGWERRTGCYFHLATGCLVRDGGNGWTYSLRDGIARIVAAVAQPLTNTIEAAESMIDRLSLVQPKANPDGWHATDGMAPPKEAGDRVIEAVDRDCVTTVGPADHERHCWGSDAAIFRPTKWRYADGAK